MSIPSQPRRSRTGHFVINGADGLAYRLADHLASRYGSDVVVLMTGEQHRALHRDFQDLPRVHMIVVDRVDEKALVQADIATASGLALTVQDDVSNIHLALQARELAPLLRLVIRMYNTRLGAAIETLLGECRVLSDAEIAAPALIATTLDEVAASPVEVGPRTLIVARRADVPERDIICGLADTSIPGQPGLLPADPGQADLVLADVRSAKAEELLNTGRNVLPQTKRRRWQLPAVMTFLRTLLNRKLGLAFIVVLGAMLVSGATLAFGNRQIGVWDGFYLTLVNAFGGPQERADFTHVEQALQLVIGIAGLALVPLVTALIVEGMVNARFAVAQGRLLQPHADHIVLVGLGGVGTRVLRLLYDRGVEVVAIDQNENARGVALARELAVPLIIGDASRETTLRQASVESCRAIMTVASTDVVNLEVALQGRNLKPMVRVLVRIFDGDLASRVRRTFDLRFTRSVSYVAAPAFAEALMDREVIGTIAVDRRVLLVAEVVVCAGSALDSARLNIADQPGEARVIAVTERGEPRPLWNPAQDRQLSALDTLTVVCTRAGLSRLIKQNAVGDVLEPGSVA